MKRYRECAESNDNGSKIVVGDDGLMDDDFTDEELIDLCDFDEEEVNAIWFKMRELTNHVSRVSHGVVSEFYNMDALGFEVFARKDDVNQEILAYVPLIN